MNVKYSQKLLPARRFWLAVMMLLGLIPLSWAEGTRQVAPTPGDSIVILETNRLDFGNFAAYGGPEDSRLVVTIANPSEVLFIGLSGEFNDSGRPFDLGRSRYRFRIVDQAGNVVHGPFLIDNLTANVSNWTESQFGIYDATATQNGQLIYQFAPGQAGDYYIQFLDVLNDGDPKVNIAYWDFTVTQNNQPILGRIWSKNWAFRTPPTNLDFLPECEWDRPFSGVLYSYTTDGFVSRIDFSDSGFQGLSFNVAFNSTGPGNTGNVEADRQSIPGFNATAFSAEHKIFLHEPDPLVFPDGDCGSLTSSITFTCVGDFGYCLGVTVTDPGQVEIVMDFNQNGIFDPESQDVTLVYNFTPDVLAACIPWNGLRGDSSAIAFGDTVDLLFIYNRGIQHYALYDVEYMKNGFCVETVRPNCGTLDENRLFWDDRAIPEDSGTGQPKDGRSGCECGADNCRTWNNFNINADNCADRVDALTTGYGDKHTLNTWWFASSSLSTRANIPLLSCQITGETEICGANGTELTVEVSGSFETFTYSWSGPNGFSSANASTGLLTVPGEYCVTVTNPVGCESICCETIEPAESPELSVEVTNTTCDASDDGAITATATGGSGNYQFALNGGPLQSSGEFSGLTAGDYVVVVVDPGGCSDTLEVEVGVDAAIDIDYPPTLTLCPGESSMIVFTGDPTGLSFSWTPAAGIDNPNSPNPTFSSTVTTAYTVTISSIQSPECFLQEEVLVEVIPDMNLQLNGQLSGCEEETTLTASSDVSATFTWLDANGNVIGTGDNITRPLSGSVDYTLRGEDGAGCVQEIPFTLSGGPVDVAFPDTIAVCLGEEVSLVAGNQDPNDILTYSWSPASAFAGGTNTANPDYIETIGANTVFVTILNQSGCSYSDTIHIAVLNPNATYDFESELQCDGATVVFTNTSTGAFGFIWDFGDGTTSTEENPTHVYSDAGTYTVQLTSYYEASCVDTKVEEITVSEPELIAGFAFDLIDCSSTAATIAFTDNSFNSFNNTTGWLWEFSDGQTSNEQNPAITFNQSGEITVTLTITSSNGCMDSETQVIDIQLVDIDLDDEVEICPGESVTLNPGGNPDYIYSWAPSLGLDDPTAASPEASPDQTTQYTLTVLNIAGTDTCEVVDQITVIVNEAINLDLGPDIFTCGEDALITYTADVDVQVQWTSTTNGNLGTGPSVTVNPERTETIILTATNATGCMERDTILVTDQGVDVTADPQPPVTTCSGVETTISVTNLDLLDQLTYQWSPAANIVSATNGSSVTVVVESGTVNFQAIVTNQFNCADTIMIPLTAVPFEPNLPDTVFVCANTPTPLNPAPVAGYSYQWSPAEGLDDPDAANPVFTGDQTTVYSVTVTDESQTIPCETVEEVVVFVYPDINLVTTGDRILCESAPVTLGGQTDIAGVTITWYDDPGLTNVIGTGQSVDIGAITEPGIYVYTAVAVDPSNNCTDSSTVTVVYENIDDNLPPETVEVCPDTPTPIYPEGDPDLNYEWTPTDNLDLTDPSNPVFNGSETTVYTVVASDPNGECMLSTEVTVVVLDAINLDLGDDITTCGEDVVITYTADLDVAVQWTSSSDGDLGSSPSITVNPVKSDTIIATATAATGCIDRDTIIITDQGVEVEAVPPGPIATCGGEETVITLVNQDDMDQLTYEWSPAEYIISGADGPNITVVVEGGTVTFQAIVTNQFDCADTVSVVVNALPYDPNLPDTVFVCSGNSVPLHPGFIDGLTYQWSPAEGLDDPNAPNPLFSGDQTTTYSVTITDPSQGLDCESVESVVVFVYPAIDLETFGDTTLCESVPIPLTAMADRENVTFTWYDNPAAGGNPVATGASVTVTPPSGTTEFTVVATDQANCTDTATVTVVVTPILADITPPQTFCEPVSSATIMVTNLDPDQDLTYQWSPTEATDPDTGPIVTVDPNIATDYSVTITNGEGCEQVLTTTVEVFDLGALTISADPMSICLGESTEITVSGCEDCTYTWSGPGTINPQGGPVVTVTPDEDGQVVYTVLVEKGDCAEELSIPIMVTEVICTAEYFFLPNAFTPNGDNINDVLRLRSNFIEKILSFELQIYNRWGELVFQTTDPNTGWDGTHKGKELPPDVFGYWMKVVCPSNVDLTTQGNITLLK